LHALLVSIVGLCRINCSFLLFFFFHDSHASLQINYTATDAAGNVGFAVRQVNVSDTLPPTLTLNGAATVDCEAATTYVVRVCVSCAQVMVSLFLGCAHALSQWEARFSCLMSDN
jgi:hypothetical protein